MDSPQGTKLISSFISIQCMEVESESNSNGIPVVIMELVGEYIFSKYNAYAVDSWGIRRMAEESKYLELSKRALRGDQYEDRNYGVKLVEELGHLEDRVLSDQEFSDQESVFDEFISHEF